MPDEELLNELKIKAMGLGLDARFLINELIKRYRMKQFEVESLKARIDKLTGPPWDDV